MSVSKAERPEVYIFKEHIFIPPVEMLILLNEIVLYVVGAFGMPLTIAHHCFS